MRQGRRRYDPLRERRFRDADRSYRHHYGPREVDWQWYREGFRAGYGRGFREARRGYWPGDGHGYGYRRRW